MATGAVDLRGDVDAYVFTGTGSSRISTQAARTSGSVLPCVELFGPDGVRLARTCELSTSNRIDATLAQDGTHTLLISDFNGFNTGSYSISLQCLVGSCIDAIPTSLDATVVPPSLSAPVGMPALASATITNTGAAADVATADDGQTADTTAVDALSCGIVQLTGVPTQFSYQATNPTTGQLIGSPNTPANIRPGESQKFQVSLRASATVNRATFAVGQTLVAGASASNSGLAGTSADIYVGILRPDGAIEFLTGAGVVVGNAANPGSFRPLAVNVSLSAPFSVSQPHVISRPRTAGDPPGTYVFFVAAVRTGGLDQILGLATAPYTFP